MEIYFILIIFSFFFFFIFSPPSTCIHCGRYFERNDRKVAHQKICSDLQFPCVLCGQRFFNKACQLPHETPPFKFRRRPVKTSTLTPNYSVEEAILEKINAECGPQMMKTPVVLKPINNNTMVSTEIGQEQSTASQMAPSALFEIKRNRKSKHRQMDAGQKAKITR
jgi:hypothetical protein